MQINYAISPYPTLLENMVAKAYEASSPNAEVASYTIPERDNTGTPTVGAGHQVPASISFTGLDRVPHVIRLFTASGNLLHWYDEQPKEDTITLFDPIFFKVGDGGTYTPITDSSTLSNPAFAGLEAKDLTIYQQGYMPLLPVIDYTISGNDVTLINGTVFELDQPWYILKRPQIITTPVNDSVVGKGFGGFIDVVADIDYIPGHLRKLIRLSGTGNYTFQVSTPVPIGYNHHFVNFGAEGSTPQINFSNGTLLWGSTPKSFLVIPFGSTVCFTWDGTHWNCTMNDIKTSAVPVAGDVIGMGNYIIGDVSATGPDTFVTVVHGLGIVGNYKVFGTLKGTYASRYTDNNVTWSAYDYTANDFKISLQEWAAGIQNLGFDYILIKQ